MGPLLGTLRQVRQPVRDLDRAIAFYGDVLGLRLRARFGPLAFFDLGPTRLLVEVGDGQAGSVLYLGVDDIHAARAELAGRGVTFIDEPQVIHHDGDGTFGPAGEDEWMTFFHDGEGNVLALSSRQRPSSTPA